MIKQILFDKKVEVGISDISDGNMRFFNCEDESKIINNQKRLGKLLSLTGEKIARVRTIYENRNTFTDYYEITDNNLSKYAIVNSEKQIPVSDGLTTKCHNTGILLPLADCLGMVVFDEEHQTIGLLHSGRQNIEQYGPKKFIQFFTEKYSSNPKQLKIYFSPYALNYKIYKFDNKSLSEVAKEQLKESGVLQENVIDFRVDTVNSTNLPSNSNGDKTRRFAIVVKQI